MYVGLPNKQFKVWKGGTFCVAPRLGEIGGTVPHRRKILSGTCITDQCKWENRSRLVKTDPYTTSSRHVAIVTACKGSLGQGNVFIGVCSQTGGSLYDVTSGLAAWSHIPSRGVSVSGPMSRGSLFRESLSGRPCDGRYASYWNAFLLFECCDWLGRFLFCLFARQNAIAIVIAILDILCRTPSRCGHGRVRRIRASGSIQWDGNACLGGYGPRRQFRIFFHSGTGAFLLLT